MTEDISKPSATPPAQPCLLLAAFTAQTLADDAPAYGLARPLGARDAAHACESTVLECKGTQLNGSEERVLARFGSARDALRCALRIQREAAIRSEAMTSRHRIVCTIALDTSDDDAGTVRLEQLSAMAGNGDIALTRSFRDAVGTGIGSVRAIEPPPGAEPSLEAYRIAGSAANAMRAAPLVSGVFTQPPSARWGALIAAILLAIFAALVTFLSDAPTESNILN